MFGLGMQELLVIMVIVLLLFGGSRLPGIAAGLGGAVNSFKKALKGDDDDRSLNADNAAATKVPTPETTTTTNKQG
jgi:sec-independent protein translocase protein TatA